MLEAEEVQYGEKIPIENTKSALELWAKEGTRSSSIQVFNVSCENKTHWALDPQQKRGISDK